MDISGFSHVQTLIIEGNNDEHKDDLSGITDCKIIPLWDYELIWKDGINKNNGRVYAAIVNSLGEMPNNEMSKIGFFSTIPMNYTYKRKDGIKELKQAQNLKKYRRYKCIIVSGHAMMMQAVMGVNTMIGYGQIMELNL